MAEQPREGFVLQVSGHRDAEERERKYDWQKESSIRK